MYNGIGLQTARGSGTNGYVQRNLSFVKQSKNKIEYKTEDDFKKLEAEINRMPNQQILDHQKKRQIELKCLQMQECMEEQGFSAEEVLNKVNEFRDVLNKQTDPVVKKKEWLLDSRQPNVRETHQMAELNHDRNDKLKHALGISPHFIEGSSLDATRKAKEAIAAEALLQQKKYQLIKDPSPEPEVKSHKMETKHNEKHKKKEKLRKDKSHKKRHSRKHSSESESESDSDSHDSHRSESNSKRKKSKSYDRKIKDKKRSTKRGHKSRKYAKYSDSSSRSGSGSDSESTSDSSSESGSESESRSSSSSVSSNYNSKSSRKEKYSPKVVRKRSSSPPMNPKLKSQYDYKGSSYEKIDNKTSYLIEKNIKQVRKETENSFKSDKHRNDEKKDIQDSNGRTPKSLDTKSDYSSDSPIHDSRVKRLKSAVYESDGSKKAKEIPKSYSSNYYHKRSTSRDHSVSPKDKSRHSSRSRQRSRSRSLKSNDSRSSNQSSSSSSASDVSSRSVSRSRSRSLSIPRRKGSPSFLDKRRITSARKRPIPYRRGSPTLSSHSSNSSSHSRSRSRSRSLSISSSLSYSTNTNTYI